MESASKNFIYDQDEDRADRALVAYTELSRNQIQRLIAEGHISVNGKTIQSKDKIKRGDQITLFIPDSVAISLEPENIPIEFLYQDSDIAILNKPQGLTVHPAETQKSGTLVNALLYHLKNLSGIGGETRPGIVHRLDKFTSGVMVVTKNDYAQAKLAQDFAIHRLERKYWALVYGDAPFYHPLRHQTQIDRSPTDRKKMTTKTTTGRSAISHFKTLESFQIPGKKPFLSLVEATLETGRTHQVRVHLHDLGHSVVGDPVYGFPTERATKWMAIPQAIRALIQNLPGQALHAQCLAIHHPRTDTLMTFTSDPPKTYQDLLDTLRHGFDRKIIS